MKIPRSTNNNNPSNRKYDYICDHCSKPATHALSAIWYLHKIETDGDLTKIQDWDGENDEYFCDECLPY